MQSSSSPILVCGAWCLHLAFSNLNNFGMQNNNWPSTYCCYCCHYHQNLVWIVNMMATEQFIEGIIKFNSKVEIGNEIYRKITPSTRVISIWRYQRGMLGTCVQAPPLIYPTIHFLLFISSLWFKLQIKRHACYSCQGK